MTIPGQLLGQFRIAAGQFHKPGMSQDPLGDELHFIEADTLAVVGAVLVPLQEVIGSVRGAAGGPLWFEGLLTEMAADHGVYLGDLPKDLITLLLNGGCGHELYIYYTTKRGKHEENLTF